jgi:hypothetical protein
MFKPCDEYHAMIFSLIYGPRREIRQRQRAKTLRNFERIWSLSSQSIGEGINHILKSHKWEVWRKFNRVVRSGQTATKGISIVPLTKAENWIIYAAVIAREIAGEIRLSFFDTFAIYLTLALDDRSLQKLDCFFSPSVNLFCQLVAKTEYCFWDFFW